MPARALHGLGHERVEADVLHRVGRLLAAGELDHVAHERGELLRLLDDVGEQGAALLGREPVAVEQHLGVRAQGGHRRAQLVRRVGHELALGGAGGREPPQHGA